MDVLDNPMWHALTGPHARFAEGEGLARRYQADVAPFMAIPDDASAAAWEALAAMVGPGGGAFVFRFPRPEPPPGWERMPGMRALQMVATERIGEPGSFEVLGAVDVADMTALVERSRPGPFLVRTYELGTYLGARDADGLFAMAGERVRPPGYSEVSAVCTDERARGQGYATRLVRAIAAVIEARGDTPVLHVLESNENAIRIYRALGFETRVTFEIDLLRAPS
jgi:ribosomal protein S18 acetylase RimI-like enzyme